jgi:hypothetical protein
VFADAVVALAVVPPWTVVDSRVFADVAVALAVVPSWIGAVAVALAFEAVEEIAAVCLYPALSGVAKAPNRVFLR